MSDHIDGPRTIADPSIDLTDLFAFTQPSDAKRLVLIADVFPFAGETGVFSNAASYSIVVRRVRISGRGGQSNIEPFGQDIRFTFNFEVLSTATAIAANVSPKIQQGACTLPSGEVVPLVVGDENGSYSQDRSVRIFAGVRSDPFYIGWVLNTMKSVPNYLEDDNVMGLVVELDVNQFLPLVDGTLFGVVAETSPRNRGPETLLVPRYDWVGRPEQTNFIINAIPNSVDLRDLWNQQTPFANAPAEVSALFKKRLRESFEFWDMRDGKKDWDPALLDAHVNLRMNDFLVFDVSKPITNNSHLEIEQSTIDGKPYATGGGRTVDANVIDILVTYLINRNQGKFYQSAATQATQPGLNTFPYLAPPNKRILKISESVELLASPGAVWSVVGQFDGLWNPLVASIKIVGSGMGQLREIETIDGKSLVERLDAIDALKQTLSYSLVSGIPAKPYAGVIQVSPVGTGSKVTWTVDYRPSGQGELIVRMIIHSLITRGLKALQDRFGVAK
jgi:Domain of unknown function (DUF4331)/Polyketide cyclase / dehydrase and lipid transport